ncbi:MAG: hypothetical protein ABI679_07040 [Gemmatimonadota bacterium]
MNDDILRGLYRQHLARRIPSRDLCPSVESIEALVSRTGEEAERLITLDHVMACPACRHEFDLVRTAGEAARASARPSYKLPLALAAGIVSLVAGALFLSSRRDAISTMRGESDGIALVLPDERSVLRDSALLTWHAVPDAFQYHVEVLEVDGALRYQRSSQDTVATVPGDSLTPGKAYVWWVRADLATAGERRSELRRFTFKSP